ncbi:hypothetical protein [Marisediminitalea sp.]|uniref:hypothetical protein n=1 Tax=Marisediminitalea sp. TaxID=2662268 RepID=UPI003513BD1B
MQPIRRVQSLWLKRDDKKTAHTNAHDLLVLDAQVIVRRQILNKPLPKLLDKPGISNQDGIYLFPFQNPLNILDSSVWVTERQSETVSQFMDSLKPEEYIFYEQDIMLTQPAYKSTGKLPGITLYIEDMEADNKFTLRPAVSPA